MKGRLFSCLDYYGQPDEACTCIDRYLLSTLLSEVVVAHFQLRFVSVFANLMIVLIRFCTMKDEHTSRNFIIFLFRDGKYSY